MAVKVKIPGHGGITLTDTHLLGSGGEGSVYARSGTAYKIYHDPKKMIPIGKIDDLSKIKDPNVIRPQEVLLGKGDKPVGYTMRHLSDTHAICQLFTNAFRKRHGVTPDISLDLARGMIETYQAIHAANVLVVDGNEMNFLTDRKFKHVFFIDVDSYQTKNYKATALMESIRDRHCAGKFSEETDWFAWGIVSFNLLIGIHPFKGRHSKLQTLDQRMEANVSVFNDEVDMPRICRPIESIPSALRNWYQAVFERGERMAPPHDFDGMILVITDVKKTTGTNNFSITPVSKENSEVVDYISFNGLKAVLTEKETLNLRGDTHLLFDHSEGAVRTATISGGQLSVKDHQSNNVASINMKGEQLTSYNGTAYFKLLDKLYQVVVHSNGNKILVSTKLAANVHENSSKLFPGGLVIQSFFGKGNITLLPEPGLSYSFKLDDVKGRVVDAKHDNRVIMIVTVDTSGKYHRHVLRVKKDFSSIEVMEVVSDITYLGLNFATLDKGVCCHINEDGDVELFANSPGNTNKKVIRDPAITQDMKLLRDGDTILVAQGNQISKLTMK
jgi:hypothetical protein